jgi:hypothetical protein
MEGNLDLVVKTTEDPDYIIVAGRKGELSALRHYETTSISEKSVVAIYREFADSRMEGDLIYHYSDEELVGVTILHASEIGQQGEASSR